MAYRPLAEEVLKEPKKWQLLNFQICFLYGFACFCVGFRVFLFLLLLVMDAEMKRSQGQGKTLEGDEGRDRKKEKSLFFFELLEVYLGFWPNQKKPADQSCSLKGCSAGGEHVACSGCALQGRWDETPSREVGESKCDNRRHSNIGKSNVNDEDTSEMLLESKEETIGAKHKVQGIPKAVRTDVIGTMGLKPEEQPLGGCFVRSDFQQLFF